MLNKETKRKIDAARNILVGVLPLPTDQIELITIALIYKFMDDQDEELRSVGLEEKFFVDELKDYSWQQLMSNQLSADQRVTKFINAIEEIQKASNIPQLFKEIFSNTFLKFRDGRVLQLFLDKIDEFTYDHSEELGNAFEYLLMTMGAQGDNGQFRTPRNIIDFIVEVVNPTKNDTIIDPACGTGGFLVSAYKHILRNNTTGLENYKINLKDYEIDGIPATLGDKLNATERKKLEENVEGYDNTPLMVRLARVNLYLHHFTNPQIHEYSTLNYDTRWKEKFDCILANPPFMTPKGGIEPHDKFRIRANRTELLFADYILEHLTPNGKAGFVVPEGIIFQNSSDYIELRKWLIYEAGLWAVVSLPSNIFQPYSGVKTSILFIDREIARSRDEILLVKVENDGFSLNTNRAPIDENDLPDALKWMALCKTNIAKFKKAQSNEKDGFVNNLLLIKREQFAKLDIYKSTSAVLDYSAKLLKRVSKSITEINDKIEAASKQLKNVKNKVAVNESKELISSLEKKKGKTENIFLEAVGINFLPKSEKDLAEWFDKSIKQAVIEYGVNLNNTKVLSTTLIDLLDNQRDYDLSIELYQQLGELKENLNYKWVPLNKILKERNERVGERKEVPVLSITMKNGLVDQAKKFKSNISSKDIGSYKLVEKGQLVIGFPVNEGVLAVLKTHKVGAVSPAYSVWDVSYPKLDTDYFDIIIKSPPMLKEYTRLMRGTTGRRKTLSKDTLLRLHIPVPNMEEQLKIVALQKEITKYEKLIDDTKDKIIQEINIFWN